MFNKVESEGVRPAAKSLFGRVVVVSIVLHALVLFFVAAPTSAPMVPAGKSLIATLRLQPGLVATAPPAAQAVAPQQAPTARALQPAPVLAVPQETPRSIAVTPVAQESIPAPRTPETPVSPGPAEAALTVAAQAVTGNGGAGGGVGSAATVADSAAAAEAEAVALARYRRAVLREVGRVKSYPEAARQAGYSGKVTVQHQLVVGRPDPQVSVSSSTPMLDKMGLEMVRLAAERVAVPEVLAKSTHSFNVAILFNLID